MKTKGFQVMKIDARQKAALKQIHGVIQEACKEKIERDRRRGILNRPVRAMVVGIPNVGKSTFINSLCRKGLWLKQEISRALPRETSGSV